MVVLELEVKRGHLAWCSVQCLAVTEISHLSCSLQGCWAFREVLVCGASTLPGCQSVSHAGWSVLSCLKGGSWTRLIA